MEVTLNSGSLANMLCEPSQIPLEEALVYHRGLSLTEYLFTPQKRSIELTEEIAETDEDEEHESVAGASLVDALLDEIMTKTAVRTPSVTDSVERKTPGGFRGKHMPNGRKATPATYIGAQRKRSVTFSKRKTGLMDKISQLVWLTGANAFCLIQQVPKLIKKEDMNKEAKNIVGQAYAIEVHTSNRNNYAYACNTWRSLFQREEIKELIDKPFDPDAMMDTKISVELIGAHDTGAQSSPIKKSKKSPSDLRLKVVQLKDKHSPHEDSYCNVSFGSKRKGLFDSSKLVMLDADEQPEETPESGESDEEEEDEGCTDEEEEETNKSSVQKKKRGPVVLEFIKDPKKRSTCFCKRKIGLMTKAFEISGKTKCRLLLVLSYPEQEGGSDLLHVYASPDWRKDVFTERFLSLFRTAQLVERPVFGFFAPPKVLEPPKPMNPEELFSAEQAQRYFGYYLPVHVFEHKVIASVFKDRNPVTTAKDAYLCFVWRERSNSAVVSTSAKQKSLVKIKKEEEDVKIKREPVEEPTRAWMSESFDDLPVVNLRTDSFSHPQQALQEVQTYIQSLTAAKEAEQEYKKAQEQPQQEIPISSEAQLTLLDTILNELAQGEDLDQGASDVLCKESPVSSPKKDKKRIRPYEDDCIPSSLPEDASQPHSLEETPPAPLVVDPVQGSQGSASGSMTNSSPVKIQKKAHVKQEPLPTTPMERSRQVAKMVFM